MSPDPGHRLVRLPSGAQGVHSLEYGETMHSTAGPAAEAEALYVRQIGLRERLANHAGPFVIWDVGLGAAANVLTVLRSTRDIPGMLHVLSFDNTDEPLRFAHEHAADLGYFEGYEEATAGLLDARKASFRNGAQQVEWAFRLGDFPSQLQEADARNWPKPHVLLFDPFSPRRNPAMWTAPLFTNLYNLLDPDRPCVMPTYSRSTMLRVALLVAGFHVGTGQSSGVKEETTVAANDPALLALPLDARWLERAKISSSAEPLWEAVYRQAPLQPETLARLRAHPQFA